MNMPTRISIIVTQIMTDATCTITDGSYQSACNSGYAGDGTTCQGIESLYLQYAARATYDKNLYISQKTYDYFKGLHDPFY